MAGRSGLMPQREDGACKYLSETNECTIYKTRPDICRIDKAIELFNLDKEKWYKVNAESCNSMQEKLGIDSKFRVEV